MAELTAQEDFDHRLEDAAIAFAFDHGPLAAAGRGEVQAREFMRNKLAECLGRVGLEVTQQEAEK